MMIKTKQNPRFLSPQACATRLFKSLLRLHPAKSFRARSLLRTHTKKTSRAYTYLGLQLKNGMALSKICCVATLAAIGKHYHRSKISLPQKLLTHFPALSEYPIPVTT